MKEAPPQEAARKKLVGRGKPSRLGTAVGILVLAGVNVVLIAAVFGRMESPGTAVFAALLFGSAFALYAAASQHPVRTKRTAVAMLFAGALFLVTDLDVRVIAELISSAHPLAQVPLITSALATLTVLAFATVVQVPLLRIARIRDLSRGRSAALHAVVAIIPALLFAAVVHDADHQRQFGYLLFLLRVPTDLLLFALPYLVFGTVLGWLLSDQPLSSEGDAAHS